MSRFTSGDFDLNDIADLREAYVRTELYRPYNTQALTDDLRDAFHSQNYDRVIELVGESFVDSFPLFDLHYFAMKTHEELGDSRFRRWHGQIAWGTIDLILEGRDGRTPESSFYVINVREQYIVLNYLRLTSTGVSTMEIDGVSYDVHRVTPESDEPGFDVYFDISAPAAWLRNNLN